MFAKRNSRNKANSGCYLHVKSIEIDEKSWSNTISESIGDDFNMQNEDIINFIQFTYANEKKSYNSTSNIRYNSTSGLNSLPRMISGNSI